MGDGLSQADIVFFDALTLLSEVELEVLTEYPNTMVGSEETIPDPMSCIS